MFFTCFACGETLKKSAVDRHSQSCKACWIIVCVDCNTRFEGGAYAAHTTCISEAEKYEKTAFKGAGKGGKRDPQAEWCDTIARAAGAPEAPHAALLAKLTGFGNCPRKIRPFVSFCRNSLKVHNEKLLGDLFAQIQAHLPPRAVKAAKGGAAGAGAEEEEEDSEEGEAEGASASARAAAPAAEAVVAAETAVESKRAKKSRREEPAAEAEVEAAAQDAGGDEEGEAAAEARASAKRARREERASAAAASAAAAPAAPAPAMGAKAARRLARQAQKAAAGGSGEKDGEEGGAGEGEGKGAKKSSFDAKAFIKEQLGKAKNGCLKPKKLAQAASKAQGSSNAVNDKIIRLLEKGKLVRCDFRGKAVAATKAKGKYVKRAPKEAKAAAPESAE